jgi:hypothetical protein
VLHTRHRVSLTSANELNTPLAPVLVLKLLQFVQIRPVDSSIQQPSKNIPPQLRSRHCFCNFAFSYPLQTTMALNIGPFCLPTAHRENFFLSKILSAYGGDNFLLKWARRHPLFLQQLEDVVRRCHSSQLAASIVALCPMYYANHPRFLFTKIVPSLLDGIIHARPAASLNTWYV